MPCLNNTIEILDQLVEDLRVKKVFASYEEPLQVQKDLPSFSKQEWRRNSSAVAGSIFYLGDAPYDGSAPREISTGVRISKASLHAKTLSISKAIEAYIPFPVFSEYVNEFCRVLCTGSPPEALLASLRKYARNTEDELKNIPYQESEVFESPDLKGAPFLELLRESELKSDASEHSELVFCLGLLQAAHACYVADLGEAIDRNSSLTDQEKENACGVINVSFQTFGQFTFMVSLLPLVGHAYRGFVPEKDAEGVEQPTRHDVMVQSIGGAWDEFFKRGVLKRTYSPEKVTRDVECEKGQGSISQHCPVQGHFRRIKEAKLVEDLYQFVVGHRRQLTPYISLFETSVSDAFPEKPSKSRCPYHP